MIQKFCGAARVSQDIPSQIQIRIHGAGVSKMQETQQSQECTGNNAWFSFPALDIGPNKVITVSNFTEQKDTVVVHHSLFFSGFTCSVLANAGIF